MPIVTIQVTREGSGPGRTSVTAEEKSALIAGASKLLLDVLHKPLEATFVVIEEVETRTGAGRPAGVRVPKAACRRRLSRDSSPATRIDLWCPPPRKRG
jgi:4-oxalocrotonate tautomerase